MLSLPEKKRKKGFTLPELLVVVLILGVLASITLPLYQKYILRSRAADAINLLEIVKEKQHITLAKSRDREYISDAVDLRPLTAGGKEVVDGLDLIINDKYTLTLDEEKQCAMIAYKRNNLTQFTFATAYDRPGLGCSGSVCAGFGSTVTSIDDVCTESTVPNTPGSSCTYTGCGVGQIWSNEECQCNPCPSCGNGYHYTGEGCACAANPCDDPNSPNHPCPPPPPSDCTDPASPNYPCPCDNPASPNYPCPDAPTCVSPFVWNGSACACPAGASDISNCTPPEGKICSNFDNSTCMWNYVCSEENPLEIENGKVCSNCQSYCGENFINLIGGICEGCGRGYELVEGKCIPCPEDRPRWRKKKGLSAIKLCENSSVGECVACPESTPVYSDGDCISCDTSTGGQQPVWNPSTRECITCYDSNPSTPVWNGTSCEACPADRPIFNNGTCQSCYQVYGESRPVYQNGNCISCYQSNSNTPVWDQSSSSCVSCFQKYPGSVSCGSGGYASVPKATFREYLTDYLVADTGLSSYALQSGALLAEAGGSGGSSGGGAGDCLCGATTCTSCTPSIQYLGPACSQLSHVSPTNTTSCYNSTTGSNGTCTCTQHNSIPSWDCPNNCDPVYFGYTTSNTCTYAQAGYNCTPSYGYKDYTGKGTALTPTQLQAASGSCANTWNGASIEPAKPVWNGSQCVSCGATATQCSYDRNQSLVGPTFSGQVWNGTQCVNVSTLSLGVDVVGGGCYFIQRGITTVSCTPPQSNNSTTQAGGTCAKGDPLCQQNQPHALGECTSTVWYSSNINNANNTVRTMFNSSPDSYSYGRMPYTKSYHAVAELGVAPSLIGHYNSNGTYSD